MPEWFTPPQIARQRQLRVGKVLTWIRTGQLLAVNCAEQPGGRPRWRVSAEALAAFDAARSNRAHMPHSKPRSRRTTRRDDGVIQFFR